MKTLAIVTRLLLSSLGLALAEWGVSAGQGTVPAATAKRISLPNPGLENRGEGWWAELGPSKVNGLEWAAEEAREGKWCAKLIYSGKEWLWLNTPPLEALPPEKEVTLAFQAKWLDGGRDFSVGCNVLSRADKRWAGAHDQLWVGELPGDSQWHDLEIKFRTPAFDFRRSAACIKLGPRLGPATVLIDNVRIVSVAEPTPEATGAEPFDAARAGAVKFDLTEPRWLDSPFAFRKVIDIQEWLRELELRGVAWPALRMVGLELPWNVDGSVHVLAPAEVKVRMGFPETFRLVLENSSSNKATIALLGGEGFVVLPPIKSLPANQLYVEVEPEMVEVPAKGWVEARVRLQTVRAEEFDLVLKVREGKFEGSLRVRIKPQVTYPVFGLVEHFVRCPPRERGSFLDPKTNAKAEADMTYLWLLPCQVFRVDGPGCWNVVEPEKGRYFFDAADWHVEAIRKFGGSRAVMLLGYEPFWAQPFFDPRETEKLDHWRDYVRALVRRYRDRVDYWEVWNEPYGFWFGGAGKRKKLFEKHYATECSPILAEVIRIASEVIRQEAPDARILTPGFVPDAKKAGTAPYQMMEKLFQMGIGDWVDFINLHIYPLGFQAAPLAPSRWKVDGKEMVSWEKTLGRWRQFDEEITMRDLRALMEKYGVKNPIWITEFGGHPAKFERAQGLGILRQAAVLVSEGAKGLHYYEFYDYPHELGRFELVRHTDHYRTLGLVAYSQAIRYLTGASYEPERCEIRRDGADEAEVPCRVFGRGGETIVCLWSNSPKPAEIEIRTQASFASAQVSTFSPEGLFLSEQALLPATKPGDGPIRVVSERHLVAHINPLQFMILALRQ